MGPCLWVRVQETGSLLWLEPILLRLEPILLLLVLLLEGLVLLEPILLFRRIRDFPIHVQQLPWDVLMGLHVLR